MKKCPYCGKEYPDEVERCLIDDELLLGKEPDPAPPAASPPPIPGERFTERQWIIIELVLICALAFGSSLIGSVYYLMYPWLSSGSEISGTFVNTPGQLYAWFLRCFHEILALGLLLYVLMRHGRSFRNLGLTWTVKDVGWGIVLLILGSLASGALYDVLYFMGLTTVSRHAAIDHTGQMLFAGGISAMTILFQILNPFFEELIVRAYVMTEVKRLTGSATKAIMASVVLQTSYHFYQGVPSALMVGVTFLIFAIFYARTNRITPIILAHLYVDVVGTLRLLVHH